MPHGRTTSYPQKGSVSEPKAGDYEPHVAKMLSRACHQYEVLLAIDPPFPELGTSVLRASRAWANVCCGDQVSHNLSDSIEKIVSLVFFAASLSVRHSGVFLDHRMGLGSGVHPRR